MATRSTLPSLILLALFLAAPGSPAGAMAPSPQGTGFPDTDTPSRPLPPRYGGPRDTVPAGNPVRAAIPMDGGAIGQITPSSLPTGGGPLPLGPTGAAGTRGSAANLLVDPSQWEYWWEYNKDAYLQLKRVIHHPGGAVTSDAFSLGQGEARLANQLKPSPKDVHTRVIPALLTELEEARNEQLVASLLMALAKVGGSAEASAADDDAIVQALASHIVSANQTIAERAVIALGVHGKERSAMLLSGLLLDSTAGQKLANTTRVSARMRSFAAYAMGLIGSRTEREDVRRFIVHKLASAFELWDGGTFDLPVACVSAMGVVPLGVERKFEDREGTQPPTGSRQAQISWLLDLFEQRATKDRVRAHIPTAMARLCRGLRWNSALREKVAETCISAASKRSSAARETKHGCILALGIFIDADDDPVDTRVRQALDDMTTETGDQVARNFALVSLAQAASRPGPGNGAPLSGVPAARARLSKQLSRGRSTSHSWSGLALGLLGRRLADARVIPETAPSEALRQALLEADSTSRIGAFCVAAGLRKAGIARALLLDHALQSGDLSVRSYAALGLGLMEDRSAKPSLRELVASANSRPDLMSSAAIGDALLGDKELVPQLIEMLAEEQSHYGRATVLYSLGSVGDARCLDSLIDALQADAYSEMTRAFAAVALGTVADKDPLPWRAVYAAGINYLAGSATMIEVNGIFDIP